MANSLLLKSSAIPLDSNRPKFARDPMWRPGTKFQIDWSRPRCHPNGKITAATLTGSAIVPDLSPDAVNVTIGSGHTINADGSIVASAVTGKQINIGSAGQFDMAPAEYEYVMILWLKLTTGYITTNYQQLMGLSVDDTANNAQCWFDTGLAGRRPRCSVAGTIYGATADISLDVPYQIAVHYTPGGRLDYFQNGVFVQGSTGAPGSVTAAASSFFRIPDNAKKTIYRASLVDISASVAAEAVLGYPPEMRLTGRQHILRDYQFCTNQIEAAPKAAFA